jgi:hypothetical protein
MSLLPLRVLVKAIFAPSGDHAGSASKSGLFAVRLTGFEPSAFITQMSLLPLRVLVKAIFAPSGDHVTP